MNAYFLAAAAAAFLLGLAHSVLGEMLIFRSLAAQATQSDGSKLLGRRHLAALRSTWHLATLFGWGLAALFFWMAQPDRSLAGLAVAIAAFLTLCAVFWLIGTRGRHPAWIVFLVTATLSYLGAPA